MDKDSIRRRVKARKSLLSDEERLSAAQSVFHRLEQLAAFTLSHRILVYNSLPDELSTRDFIQKWNGRKRFFLPRVNGVDLDILPFDQTRMHIGAFRIEEPTGDDCEDVDTMEMIIVPAVAFDRRCNRVGRGKGYYDRLLKKSRAITVGVGYDFQMVDQIDTDYFDVPVDIVITESGTYRHTL